MELVLSDKYQISTDQFNYILQEKSVVKDGNNAGQEYTKNIGYYGKLEQALKVVLDLKIKDVDKANIKQLHDHLALINDVMKDMVKRLETQMEGLK
ncbi:hypothetical protein GC105_10635 [Alkalibaculum sp. M08DMB]|uniref:DUF5405 domain-containing protein n=1 Tax=Alkalibaculum sporogenes TaxID=2655001 RepID=A0A6A7K9Y2_9FIRM|nr:hypothetical protein [Alkalibaculum sporogenes]MPW26244.1 hypothetical protein [Alkalibaculum sporogenes]